MRGRRQRNNRKWVTLAVIAAMLAAQLGDMPVWATEMPESGTVSSGDAGAEILSGSEEDLEPVYEAEDTAAEVQEEAQPELQLDYILGREMTEEEERQQLELFDWYASQGQVREAVEIPESVRNRIKTDDLERVGLPSSYDSRNVNGACYITPVRNQGGYDTCWAFATIACIEANLVKNGYADTSLDLSERHLVYFAHHSAADKLGNGDGDLSYYSGSNLYKVGGNTDIAYRALAAWKGAVEEEFCPYSGIPEAPDTSLAAVYDHDYAHLTGYYHIAAWETDQIKRAIMEYGAVEASYYASSKYLNPSTAAYFCNESMGCNHSIAIVGWDDSYSRDNFRYKPESDGAWLVKNSYGTTSGNKGYLWLSYEDHSIWAEMHAYEAEPAGYSDNNYQYDTSTGGLTTGYFESAEKFAAVYTVKGAGDRKERLTGVSIETLYSLTDSFISPEKVMSDVKYSLQIYKNLKDPANPESGEALLSKPQTGILEHAGYYVIPLEEIVLLNQDDVFSTVFTLSHASGMSVKVAVESDFDIGGDRYQDFYSHATSEQGQNFIYWGGRWGDFGSLGYGNLRMKAFTKNTDVASVKCTGVKISQSTAQLYVDGTLQLSAKVLPENATNKSCTWKSSDTRIVTVDESGRVKAVGEGTATVSVTTLSGNFTASCQIVVKKKVLVKPPNFQVKGIIGGREVTFASATEGAVIYYSTSSSTLTTKDLCVKNGEKVVFEDYYGTVYARAYYEGVWSNVARLILKIPVVNTPVITQSGGIVNIRTTTPDCAIYYTTDGSTPSLTNGTRINASQGTFWFTGGTVKAIAVRNCFTNSRIAEASITSAVSSAVHVPSFVVKGVIGGRTVTFNSQTSGSRIFFSTSSTMTSNDRWVECGKSVTFENFYGTIYARTYANGKWSNVSRLILKIPVVNKPTITDVGNGRVRISTSTPDCAIYYTTDGSTPSPTNGTRIGASSSIVTVGSGKTVKAIAVRSCFTNSDVAVYKQK